MKAIYYTREQGLLYSDLPDPVVARGEVLVRVHYAGICGSDLHLFKSGMLPPQAIMGHEVSGTIEALGEGVGERKVGDRVIIRPIGCGSCPVCKEQKENLCPGRRAIGLGQNPGGYAEKIAVPWGMTIPVPENVPLDQAALTDPVATALHAIRQARPLQKKSALVLGAGVIGLSLLLLLKKEGAKPILVSELEERRREMALQLGADGVVQPRDDGALQVIQSLTGGRGPAAAFECSGSAGAFEQALRWVAKDGEIILVGLGGEPFCLPPIMAVLKEARIIGSFANTREECRETLRRMARGEFSIASLTRDRIFLKDLPGVFQELLKGSPRNKVIVQLEA